MKLTRCARLCPWLLAATLTAQVATAPSAPDVKPGSIEGTVTDAVTHAPIRRAFVPVARATSPGAYRYFVGATDDAGKFTIAGVDPGQYTVQDVEAQGYMYERPGRMPIAVAEDQQVTGLKIELTPLGVIAGKVLDEDGEPLRGVRIQAIGIWYWRGTRRWVPDSSASTDDRGQFRLIDLPPGRYFVRAWLPPSPTLPNTHRTIPELGYAPTFFPNAGDPAEATASVVTAGSETSGVDIRLRAVPVFHIRGKVSNLPASGSPQVGARDCGRVELASLPAPYIATVQPGGGFDLGGVTPGTYCVALNPDARNQSMYATETVTLRDRSLESVNLAALPAIPVSGVVRMDGQADLLRGPSVFLQSLSSMAGAYSQASSGFTLPGLAPGTYQLWMVGLPPPLYLKSIRYGAEDVPSGAVPVRADGGVLTLAIGSDAGTLTGTVQTESGDPAAGATVTAIPDGFPPGRSDLVGRAFTDPGGKFSMPGVAPGPCKVYAWEDAGYSEMAMVPEFIKEFAGSAATVTVSPGGNATVQVKLIPAGEAQRVKARF